MNKIEVGQTNAYWPFTSLAVRYKGRCFIIIALCVPENPRQVDAFYDEYVYENNQWTLKDTEMTIDDRNYLSHILHEYMYNDKPIYFGVDFIERDLIT